MATHSKGGKYIVSVSISHEVGKLLDVRNEEQGIVKSFDVEQALRRYYSELGLITKNAGEMSGVGNVSTNHANSSQLSTTPNSNRGLLDNDTESKSRL